MHCVRNFKKENKWVAFLDIDEYLFAPSFRPLPEVLQDYEEFGAVGVHWATYGTSNVTVPDGEKLADHLVMRAPLNFEYNQYLKPIAQVKYVHRFFYPHCCLLKGPMITVDENKENTFGEPISSKISFEKLRINHYWSRDLHYFFNAKIPRQEGWFAKDSKYRDGRIQIEKEMNAVYDPILSGMK